MMSIGDLIMVGLSERERISTQHYPSLDEM